MSNVMKCQAEVLSSTLMSTLDLWRGTMLLQAPPQPRKALRLYDIEGSAACRQVREAQTALGLDAVIDHLEQRYAL